jgi:hypothetical protein
MVNNACEWWAGGGRQWIFWLLHFLSTSGSWKYSGLPVMVQAGQTERRIITPRITKPISLHSDTISQQWRDSSKRRCHSIIIRKPTSCLVSQCLIRSSVDIVMWLSDYRRGFRLMIGFLGLFDMVHDYASQVTITCTHAHMWVSTVRSSLAFAW